MTSQLASLILYLVFHHLNLTAGLFTPTFWCRRDFGMYSLCRRQSLLEQRLQRNRGSAPRLRRTLHTRLSVAPGQADPTSWIQQVVARRADSSPPDMLLLLMGYPEPFIANRRGSNRALSPPACFLGDPAETSCSQLVGDRGSRSGFCSLSSHICDRPGPREKESAYLWTSTSSTAVNRHLSLSKDTIAC